MRREGETAVGVTITPDGPLLLPGPVEVTCPDGTVVTSRRFTVALCTCRRSRIYPWCDTSHRRRRKNAKDENAEDGR
ncbi:MULTISPECIES: CDGSH iron-sulfur domain-containing protein [unclassified Streptomyces]|uniref:CDGSH iron-sulfur domain-containing protein n=1 Tax=unclassified Streptomyces TaxID=2593676 RepID=UPI002E2DF772|nr:MULTISPECIES: CDGSH iron-sulfur domain-containing protein [unclassified Streptomyces]WUB89974.1 CDGSH iron-sulfur domain-containing protein [Streptomyces sp. NBC_00566]